ncbi:hypothetical protein HON36_04515 [Candidatus Parcubacteria bacterium]|jgi:hypothetical protein|nr:hypothetical protein [Candidatus Parcubacteria bacterium]MBT7227982.1 hypothetical protein [Candidatus Parcubacteria bacterium]
MSVSPKKCPELKKELALSKEHNLLLGSFIKDENFELARLRKKAISSLITTIRMVVSPDDVSEKDMLALLNDYEEKLLGKDKD